MKCWAVQAAAGAAGWVLARVADALLGKAEPVEPWPSTSRPDCANCGPVCICAPRRSTGGWRL